MRISSLLFVGLVLGPTRDESDQQPRAATPPAVEASASISRASRQAVEDGLAYLAARQRETEDGSFSLSEVERRNYAPLGVSALATLAFLAAGNAPDRGPYGEEVERGLLYLLDHADLSSEAPHPGYISAQGDAVSQTHGHGYATLALAEAYGIASGGDERIRRALIAAVELIEGSQGTEGGWYYKPVVSSEHEGSVTICLVQALRAARDSGIQVDSGVIQRAEDYVRRLQAPDGTFRYQLGSDRTSVALTAAAVSTLNSTGAYDTKVIHEAIDAIWTGLSRMEVDGNEAEFPEYQRLYLAQAFWQLADTSHFERWYEKECERILRSQQPDGSWKNSRFGNCYATAVNCLVLSLPEGLLPIFQR